MERKTITTLGDLRAGDRFVFPKETTVHQVFCVGKKTADINEVTPEGHPLNRYHTPKKLSTKVLFLRHGIPAAGEECFLDDLQPGDTFKMLDDEVHDYVVVKRGDRFFDVRRTDQSAPIKGGKLATVILIERKQKQSV
jgi:hypothetical protein